MSILLMIMCALAGTALFAYQTRAEQWKPVERILNLILALCLILMWLSIVGVILSSLGVMG